MKKHLLIFIVLILILTPVGAARGEVDAGAVTFFESIENLEKLNGYAMNQNMSGDFKVIFDEPENNQVLTGEYRVDLHTKAYSKNPYERDFDTNFKGHIQLSMEGEKRPFDDLVLNFRGKIISIFGDGLYIKLINSSIAANGVPDEELEEWLNLKEMVESYSEYARGQWIYLPYEYYADGLKDEAPEGVRELLDGKALAEKFKKDGIKKTYEGLIKDLLDNLRENGMIENEDSALFAKISDEFFKTEFFREKAITKGSNAGLTSFYLAKPKIIKFIGAVTQILGEDLTGENIKQLSSYIDKFNISGVYRADETMRIMDIFRLKLVLRNIGPLIHLEARSAYKISAINTVKPIEGPDRFTALENFSLPFPNQEMMY